MLDLDLLLDKWMMDLHGNTYPDAHVLRLATLGYAGSLPLTISDHLKDYPDGHTGVKVWVAGQIPEDTPDGFVPQNLLERLLVAHPGELTQRVSMPKQYRKKDVIDGMSVMPTLARYYLRAEMVVFEEGDGLRIELYSMPLKRYAMVSLSQG